VRTRRRFAGIALVAMMLASLNACGGTDQPKVAGFTYVALGDSYVSGAVGKTTGACGRSEGSYPRLLAHKLRPATFRDASCGGATTANILTSTTRSGKTLAPQIDAVPQDADLVTVGVGADDGNLYPAIFFGCLLEASKKPEACSAALAAAPQILGTIQQSVVTVLQAIHNRAPGAQVILVGYLRLVPDSGTCPGLHITPQQVQGFARVEAALEAVLTAAAKATDTTFVPMHAKSAGHDACSDSAWTNALTSKRGDGIFLHPRAAGMKAVAAAVEPLVTVK
jgi:lysophospholipase L1-like esterase